jgi:predicted nucleotidyltransferase
MVHVFHMWSSRGIVDHVDLTAPYRAVLSRGDGLVLSVLTCTTRPLSGREVARLSGGPLNTVRRSLQRMAEHGLVRVQEAGSGAALLYTLNRAHLASDAVQALVNLRHRLVERLQLSLEEWLVPPLHASMFGSAARGDGDTRSDIDLFIVRPHAVDADDVQWRGQLDHLPTMILDWTGNHAGVAEVSEADVRQLVRERRSFIDELQRDAFWLVGQPLAELVEGARA